MGEVLRGSLLQLLLEHCDFLNIDISQGSVATRLRCGRIFKYELVAKLPVSLPVKEFWKSVNILGSYGQEFGVLFFSETQCTVLYRTHACMRQIAAAFSRRVGLLTTARLPWPDFCHPAFLPSPPLPETTTADIYSWRGLPFIQSFVVRV